MKKFALPILLMLLTSPVWGTTYHLAPASGGGNDSNNGTSASTPWLTPNHPVNCGDVILAAASSSYIASDFYSWGTVTCAGGNNVAWLQCATFDACKITVSNANGIAINNNYWGVQGWEVTASGTFAACFQARPPNSSTSIHHIIFANDIANGCSSTGFVAFNNGHASFDYVNIIGNIAYNAAQNGGECQSGISVYQPVKSDSVAGTHIYVAGNFSYANSDPDPCAGGTPTDGEGIIFDTWDGSQGGLPAYDQQGVAHNNMLLGNGGRGIQVFNNLAGSSHAHIYVYNNTSWRNELDTHQNSGGSCGEIRIVTALNVQVYQNIAQTTSATGCGGYPLYAYFVAAGDTTDAVYANVGYSATGNYGAIQSSGSFAYATSNLFGTNPNFANPSTPGAPSCGLASSVPNCMAAVIANFTPTTAAAKAYGYQVPSTSQTSDPLFPQWLCNVNLPPGLVTMGCVSSSSLPAPPTNIRATVK
jgi:hypothetical protein